MLSLKNMKNEKIINLYIPNWVPTLEDKERVTKILSPLGKIKYFEWIISINVKGDQNLAPVIDFNDLKTQLINYFRTNQDTKFNVIINSFSQLIFPHVYDVVKKQIKKLILLNPLEKKFYFWSHAIKGTLLPTKAAEGVLKYCYLFNHFNECDELEKRIKLIRNEVSLFSNLKLLYHKLFDQIFKTRNMHLYFVWLSKLKFDTQIIVGELNPLINLKQNKKQFNNISEECYHVIKNAGYCLIWEENVEFVKTLKIILK